MKRATTKLPLLLAAAILLAAAGCVSVDYVGQSFEPQEDALLAVFDPATEYSSADYRIIGRGSLTIPASYSQVDVYDEIESLGRQHGADAVKVISLSRELSATHYRQPERDTLREPAKNDSNYYDREFGDRINIEEQRINNYRIVVNVLLLMKQDRFDTLMSARRTPPPADGGDGDAPGGERKPL